MRTVAIFALVLCLGPLFSVAALAQTSQSVMAAGDDGRSVSTESERADGGKGSPALTGDRRPLYRLRTNDVVDISFTFASEFNQTVTVQPDGFITLRDAGHLLAEGSTAEKLEAAIGAAYGKLLHDPQ